MMRGNLSELISTLILISLLVVLPTTCISGSAKADNVSTNKQANTLQLTDDGWTKTYDSGEDDSSRAVSCDSEGNVVVAGSTRVSGRFNIWVRKYRGSDGTLLWSKTYNGGLDDQAYGVSCDKDDNPIVVGYSNNGTNDDIWVRKYSGSNGATLWTQTYDDGNRERAVGVDCDPEGNPVVAGQVRSGSYLVWVRKYSGSDGATLWTKTNSGPNQYPNGVACDSNGDAVVVATYGDAPNVWVRKYSGSNGATLWTDSQLRTTEDRTSGVSFDTHDNPIVAGYVYYSTAEYGEPDTYDIWVRKYNGSDGKYLWTKYYDGWTNDYAKGVACDKKGNPIVVGQCFDENPSYGNPTSNLVLKFSGSDGALIWTDTSGIRESDFATGVTCDPNGTPIVVGTTDNGSNDDIWVKKYPSDYVDTNSIWYLAEGTSDWGFDTYVTIENPNDTSVTTAVTYMTKDGPETRPDITLPAMSQTVINPRDDIGVTDFSTKVECKEGKMIAVDRRMIWQGAGAPSQDGHCSIGVTAPAKTWYMPEGSASWGFECWLLIQNPNDIAAYCQITYMIEDFGPQTVEKKVPANSRSSFNMADDMPDLEIKDASIMVESDIPVIPERAMYRNSRREGHDSIGTTIPAQDYYLAEGCTGWGPDFITYVLVQNPQNNTNSVTVTFLTGEGVKEGPAFEMRPNSRKTIKVNDYLDPDTDVSTLVHGELPIIAERAMYWNAGLGEACHDSIGMDSPHTTFFLPDGEVGTTMETWTLAQNPNDTDVQVEISYMTPSGTGNQVFTETIPANSRRSFNMADKGIQGRAAVMVECLTEGKKIMCERSMYWNNRGAGTDTIGGYSD